MKALILAIVLVALLVVVSAHRRPIIKQKVQSDADAEIFKKLGKFVKKIAPIAKKAYEMYGKAKASGILADTDAEFFKKLSNWWKTKGKKIFSQENIEKAYNIYKIIKNKDQAAPQSDADAEIFKKLGKIAKKVAPFAKKAYALYGKAKSFGILSDSEAEFFKKLSNWWKTKGKKMFSQENIEKAYNIYKIIKNKDQAAPQSDSELFKKLSNWWKTKGKKIFSQENIDKAYKIYKIIKNKDQAAPESDAEIFKKLGKLVKKITPIAKKGFELYGKAKSFGLFSDSENVNCGDAYEAGKKIGSMSCTTINGKLVTVNTASAFLKMKAAAAKAGVTLSLNSGFRKMSEQQYLYNCYKTKKCNNGNLAARPGYSNHQNGKALDISVVASKTYNWLANNASKFGFVRTVPSEKWHWELRNTSCNKFVRYACK